MRRNYKYTNDFYQEWPPKGSLNSNMNKSLSSLEKILMNEYGLVYAYILTTVNENDGHFIQLGSAPNFQGGLITLNTCKHDMRSWRFPEKWKDVWIAGFTGVNTTADKLNYLFYLMKVQDAFQSHLQIWNWLDAPARKAKNARYNPCGDVYEPKSCFDNEFNPLEYYSCTRIHVHANGNAWYKDINYLNPRMKKRPSLLVGNPESSYLWSQGTLCFQDTPPRTKRWHLQDFLKSLKTKRSA